MHLQALEEFMKARILTFFVMMVLCMAGLAGVANAQALTPVKLLLPIRNIDETYAAFVVAKSLGYFKEEGLDVTLLPVNGSNEVAIQIAAGNGEVGLASPAQALIGMLSGKMDVRYFFDVYYLNIWSVAVPKDSPIKELKDLRGKKIGVPAMGSAAITYGRAYVNSAKLNPQTDVTFVPIGFGGQAFAATQQRVVDAIIFYDVALLQFNLQGLPLRIIPVPEKFATLPDASLIARNDLIKKNPKVAIGMARAIAKAQDFTLANPEAAVRLTWKAYPESRRRGAEDVALREAMLVNQTRMKIWNVDKNKGRYGTFHADDWSNVVDFLVNEKILSGRLPLDRIYTNELIDQINKYDRSALVAQAKNYKVK
jgi:NitT/TauT family transport system substrate-binding protein